VANIFVISDTHFGHSGILSFRKPDDTPLRDFPDVQAMDDFMVDRWNSIVRPQDKVYHLGDVSMKKSDIPTVSRCNGHKRLLRGNHDIYPTKAYLPFFEEIYASRVLDGLIFTHIPIHPDSLGRFGANVHGHIHASPVYGPRYYNVSVEAIDYTPIALEDLKKRISR